jgi:hypothetical protein
MKHPPSELWLDYIYQELPAAQRLELDAHLAVCPECAVLVNGWRETGSRLESWHVAGPPVCSRKPDRWRWAAAAALVLLVGIAAGRWSLRPEHWRREIAAELRAEFERKLGEAGVQWQLARQQDQRVTLQLIEQAESRRVADQAVLREQIETVAVHAQNALRRAQEQLRMLALNPASGGHLSPISYEQP